jgi:hypothetical protein
VFSLNILFHISVQLDECISVHRDNIPTVVIQKWPLQATLFDEKVLAGPVPILFAEDMDSARENMMADMAKVSGGHQLQDQECYIYFMCSQCLRSVLIMRAYKLVLCTHYW